MSDVKTYLVTLLSASKEPYTGSLGPVFCGAVEMSPGDYAAATTREITIDHTAMGDSAYSTSHKAEQAVRAAFMQWFPCELPMTATFRVEDGNETFEGDFRLEAHFSIRKPRT